MGDELRRAMRRRGQLLERVNNLRMALAPPLRANIEELSGFAFALRDRLHRPKAVVRIEPIE